MKQTQLLLVTIAISLCLTVTQAFNFEQVTKAAEDVAHGLLNMDSLLKEGSLVKGNLKWY